MNKTNLQLTGIVLATLAMASAILSIDGCKPEPDPKSGKDWFWVAMRENTVVFNVDGCDYVATRYNGHLCMVHKANCTNSIHNYNK